MEETAHLFVVVVVFVIVTVLVVTQQPFPDPVIPLILQLSPFLSPFEVGPVGARVEEKEFLVIRGEVFEPGFGEGAAIITMRCWGKRGDGRHEVEDVVAVAGNGGSKGGRVGVSVLGVLEGDSSSPVRPSGGRYLVQHSEWFGMQLMRHR